MHLKPVRVPWHVVEIIMFPVTCLYVLFFGPIFAIWWLCERLKKPISPEWHPVFAWWPTRCDDWANDGFIGTVWLETVERRNKFPYGVEFRRKPSANANPKDGTSGANDPLREASNPPNSTEGEG